MPSSSEGKRVCLPIFVGDDLIERNAGLDLDQRLLHLNAGEIRARAAAVIARAIEQRAARVVGEVAELEHVVLVRLRAPSSVRGSSWNLPS